MSEKNLPANISGFLMILCWVSDLLESEDLELLAIKWFKLPARETQFPPNQRADWEATREAKKGKEIGVSPDHFYEKVVEGFFFNWL